MSEEQTVLDTRLPSLASGKEGDQISEPFLGATGNVLGLQGIGEVLKLTESRVCQIRTQILRKLRARLSPAARVA